MVGSPAGSGTESAFSLGADVDCVDGFRAGMAGAALAFGPAVCAGHDFVN